MNAAVPGSTEPPRTSLVIGVLVVASFVALLNETMLVVALPTLGRELAIGVGTAQWSTSGFLLTMAVVIPTTGFVLARFTPRRVFLVAVGLFSAGTAIAAAAPVFAVLLAGRLLQAGGTALLAPLMIATIAHLVPAERRGAAMGTAALVIAAGPAIGPAVGGLLIDRWGWRLLFVAVLPLALSVLVAGAAVLRETVPTRRVPLDVLSVGLSAVGFGGLVHGLATVGGGAVAVAPGVQVAVGTAALVVFVARQIRLQRQERALLDLRPFTRPRFRLTITIAALVTMSSLGTATVLLPLYLQLGIGATPAVSGLAVLPGGLLLALLGRPVGRFHDRRGPRPLLPLGAALIAAATWSLALLPTPELALAVALHVVLVLGIGMMTTPLLTTALGALPATLHTHGSAIVMTMQQVAGAAATAGLAAVAVALADGLPGGTAAVPDAAGLRGAFLVAGCVALLVLALALLVTDAREDGEDATEERAAPVRDDRIASTPRRP